VLAYILYNIGTVHSVTENKQPFFSRYLAHNLFPISHLYYITFSYFTNVCLLTFCSSRRAPVCS
jgi:hypothetical protein